MHLTIENTGNDVYNDAEEDSNQYVIVYIKKWLTNANFLYKGEQFSIFVAHKNEQWTKLAQSGRRLSHKEAL